MPIEDGGDAASCRASGEKACATSWSSNLSQRARAVVRMAVGAQAGQSSACHRGGVFAVADRGGYSACWVELIVAQL